MSFIDRLDEGKIVLARVLTIYTLSFGLLTALFFAAAVPVTRLMTAPPFQPAWCVVGLVAASYALKGVYLVFLPGLYIGKTPRLGRQTMIEWLAALLNVGLNFWLIPMWGLSGAAAATLVSYAALPALAWLASRDEFEVAWERRRIGMAVTLLIPGCVGLYAASKLYDQGVALIPSLMVALPSLAVACCALSMISPDDRRRLAQAVRQ
jgi:O-antigen/teichoic acid export membrane protein